MRARLSEENLDQIATDRKSKRRSVSTTTPTMIATSMKRKSCTHQLTMQFNAISQVSGFIKFFSLFQRMKEKRNVRVRKRNQRKFLQSPFLKFLGQPIQCMWTNIRELVSEFKINQKNSPIKYWYLVGLILTHFLLQARVTRRMGRIWCFFGKPQLLPFKHCWPMYRIGGQSSARVGEFIQFIGRDFKTTGLQRFNKEWSHLRKCLKLKKFYSDKDQD